MWTARRLSISEVEERRAKARNVDNADDMLAARAEVDSPYLNPQQAAHYLRVSVRTLFRHRRAGTGPHFGRPCRNVRYHIDDLDVWMRRTREDNPDA